MSHQLPSRSNITTKTTNTSWVCPAGVTTVTIYGTNVSGVCDGITPKIINVVPNTTYTVTINSATFLFNSANTFGSLYTWSSTGYVTLSWVE